MFRERRRYEKGWIVGCAQELKTVAGVRCADPGRRPINTPLLAGEGGRLGCAGQRQQKAPLIPFPVFYRFRLIRAGIAVLAVLGVAACVPAYSRPEQEQAKPPEVSYNYTSDNGLIEASSKARAYCAQYNSTPDMRGSITENPDGTRTVTFTCVKPAGVTVSPPPSTAPMSYSYSTDAGLLQAIRSADAYCARSGQAASYRVATNPDGTKVLNFQCFAR